MVGKLKREYMPLSVAVFLIGAIFLARFAFSRKTGEIIEKGAFGSPSVLVPTALGADIDSAAVLKDQGSTLLSSDLTNDQDQSVAPAPDVLYDEGAIEDPGQPIGPSFDRSGLTTYKVQSGDTLSRIASYFGISVQTILDANPGVKANSIKAGDELQILPTSGVVYQAQSGDTLISIATAFGVPQDKITQFNQSVNFGALQAGESIIIPGGTDINTNPLATLGDPLPNFNNDFVMPAEGEDRGVLSADNGVDIVNSCGTPIVAAAAGVVIPDPSTPDTFGGWNDGYGNFVLIEHPFGNDIETRYASLEKISVQIGDYVQQGQQIGLMGETDDATGCHVHFEVIGAQNPFAKS